MDRREHFLTLACRMFGRPDVSLFMSMRHWSLTVRPLARYFLAGLVEMGGVLPPSPCLVVALGSGVVGVYQEDGDHSSTLVAGPALVLVLLAPVSDVSIFLWLHLFSKGSLSGLTTNHFA